MASVLLSTPIHTRAASSLRRKFVARSLATGAVSILVYWGTARALTDSTPDVDRVIQLGAAALALVVAAIVLGASRYLGHAVTTPATELAEAAEAVAAGDFSIELRHSSADDEIGRLSRAIGAMILELRRLAEAIAASARETSTMSMEITAGSEEMAAAAGEIATTAGDLSDQATSMAETIGALASSSSSLRTLAHALGEGARDGVERNASLRALALESRAGLDHSAESLATLTADVNASVEAIAELEKASEEIRSFVTLVRKLARQSKLLALNAAMEAARAGDQGQGFAVVAAEVRRLAATSSEEADRTDKLVKSVIARITRSRESTDRSVSAANEVRVATSRASSTFADIERAVADADVWTASIDRASSATNDLVSQINDRLDVLAGGTETFAASMEQVAASSEEQSASTEEIAGAAATLGAAAERLAKLVAGLKTT